MQDRARPHSLPMPPTISTCLKVGIIFIASANCFAEEVRTWQDVSGTYSIRAVLVDVGDRQATLRVENDGREVAVPLAKLSAEDRRFIAVWREEQASAAANANAPDYRNEKTRYVNVGMEITAKNGPCQALVGTIPVPKDWPEQKVTILKEDTSREVLSMKLVPMTESVDVMNVRIPRLSAGKTARAVVSLKIEKSEIYPPADTDIFRVPERIDRNLRPYLVESPFIEISHPALKAAAKDHSVDPEKPAWPQVEQIFDWVCSHVKGGDTRPLKGALHGLLNQSGDCEERTSLFIAMCRLNGIPARSVWVQGHTYPEFYLVDEHGNGFWFPCEPTGPRYFGEMPTHAIIRQKGDNFEMPQKPEPQRYVTETLTGKFNAGSGQPEMRAIYEVVEGP